MLHQRQGLPSPLSRGGGSRIIGGKELHQGGRQLLGRPPGTLALEGVPVTVADAQFTVKPFGQGQGPFRPVTGPSGRCRRCGPGGCQLNRRRGGFGGNGSGFHWTTGR